MADPRSAPAPETYVPHLGESRQYLRDVILGVNDGLVSTFLLVAGVVGAGLPPKTVLLTGIAGAVDLLPTLAEFAGIPLIGNKPIDGRSLQPLLLGRTQDWEDRNLFHFAPGRTTRGRKRGPLVSVRNQRFRLDAVG
ncbi:MAG: VIT1/CCC1 transporter family protein, partial [Acidobacteria bacterium]|nr:VIT1/CCC1 transporter family protein [Acidobacteriota bacterium]